MTTFTQHFSVSIGLKQNLNPHEIILLGADVNYTKIYLCNDESIVFAMTLKYFEEVLKPPNFFRPHKSFIVNMAYVKTFDEKTKNLYLTNNHTITVSRRKTMEMKAILSVKL